MILRHKKRQKLQTFYSCKDTIKRRNTKQMLEWLQARFREAHGLKDDYTKT